MFHEPISIVLIHCCVTCLQSMILKVWVTVCFYKCVTHCHCPMPSTRELCHHQGEWTTPRESETRPLDQKRSSLLLGSQGSACLRSGVSGGSVVGVGTPPRKVPIYQFFPLVSILTDILLVLNEGNFSIRNSCVTGKHSNPKDQERTLPSSFVGIPKGSGAAADPCKVWHKYWVKVCRH